MNGDFSRGSLWFNLVTGGQALHTNSAGTKMAGKWDYSMALPSNGEQGNSPSPETPLLQHPKKDLWHSEKLEEHIW